MGSFDFPLDRQPHARAGRTILKSAIGTSATNDPEDLRRVETALRATGFIDGESPSAQTDSRDTVLRAIKLAEHGANARNTGIQPGSAAEIAFRRALARGSYPKAHRAILETTSPKGPRTLIGGGMRRALRKLEEASTDVVDTEERIYRRAVLPDVAPSTVQANGKLVDILCADEPRADLLAAIADAIENGGRQAFADLRNLWQQLATKRPECCATLADAIPQPASPSARRRLRKLIAGETPSEADFDL